MGEKGSLQAAQAKRQDLVDKLERGFQRVQQSDEYRRYLDTVSRFHQYSINNTMLIWIQQPGATLVAGFRTWLSLGRHVRKGEVGIRIFAPMRTRKRSPELDDEDDEAKASQLRFRTVTVFDVSQTEGDELPEPPVTHLSGDGKGLWDDLAHIAQSEGLTIDRGMSIGRNGPNGFYQRDVRLIWVEPQLAPAMAAKTLCHEIAHHFAEHADTRQENETIAESVAYIVLGHFGIDASNYSFGYLAGWSDIDTFKRALARIHAIAARIIDQITERRRAESVDASLAL